MRNLLPNNQNFTFSFNDVHLIYCELQKKKFKHFYFCFVHERLKLQIYFFTELFCKKSKTAAISVVYRTFR